MTTAQKILLTGFALAACGGCGAFVAHFGLAKGLSYGALATGVAMFFGVPFWGMAGTFRD